MNILEKFARFILKAQLSTLHHTIINQESAIHHLSADVTKLRESPEKVYGISVEAFNKSVVQKLEQPVVVGNSSEVYASYLLGIQRALTVVYNEVVHK